MPPPLAGDTLDVGQRIQLALVKLLVGVGRARRGELLTANRNIRGEALEHLLAAWAAALPGDRTGRDSLDARADFPTEAALTIRRRLGWSEVRTIRSATRRGQVRAGEPD